MNAPVPDRQIDIARLLRLLPQVATLSVCRAFLKSKGKPSSASDWAEMLEKRIRAQLASGDLTPQDIATLVHECEENSNKRIHLFQAKSGYAKHPIFAEGGVAARYPKLPNWPEFGVRSIGEMPSGQEILEVRIEEARGQKALVLKVGTKEKRRVLISESKDAQGNDVLVFGQRTFPVINVVRLFEDGLLEIRMHRDQDVKKYSGTANAIWMAIAPLIDSNNYAARPVHDVLDKLWHPKTRNDLANGLAIIKSEHRNGRQTKIDVTAGALAGGIIADPDTVATMDLFHRSKGGPDAAACESALLESHVTEKEEQQGLRSMVIHIHGEKHEFSIPAKCRKVDYDWSLSRLLEVTRPANDAA